MKPQAKSAKWVLSSGLGSRVLTPLSPSNARKDSYFSVASQSTFCYTKFTFSNHK